MSVTLDDILDAARRLDGVAVRTPLLECPALDARVGGKVFIKAETFQRVGAFKFRGAYNRLSRLSDGERKRGVVAFSSGNHAQGVALAARALGMPALIVMPSDAPRVKVEATRNYGAEIHFYDRQRESREGIAAKLARQRGAIVVPAFDDPHVIAGQGTAGLEIIEQLAETGERLSQLIGPVGGGGLMSGVSTAVRAKAPLARIWGVEPEGFDDTRRSLEAGERVGAPPHKRSLCDSLESPMPGEITFPILQANLAGIVTVDDTEVAQAMGFAFRELKLVVEPGGSVALAALLSRKLSAEVVGATVVLLSGGNVDPDLYARVITAAA
ncbi:MAG TPA: threonine/serine dehydratase [Caulobacteraceae bacterium]|jgi:threonine dehydratase|nr:threonine/serine dehydratase [Caulobacteraceae bacterium]